MIYYMFNQACLVSIIIYMLYFVLTGVMDHKHRFNYSTTIGQVLVIKPAIRRKEDNSSQGGRTVEFAQRVKEVVAQFDVTMVQIEDWVILQRCKFDIIVNDEPYPALRLYINVKTRVFITRVWGQTHSKGDIDDISKGKEICCQTFGKGGLVCCPGHIEVSDKDNLLTVEYPFKRMVALDCAVLHVKHGGQGSVELCTQCITSLRSEENYVQNMVEENGDPEIVEVEVEAKIHEVITVVDDVTTHPMMSDEKGSEGKIDGKIVESREDCPAEEPLEDDPVEEPLEDNIFSVDKRTSSKKISFRKSFLKPNQRMNYAMLLGKREPVAHRSEKPKVKKSGTKRNLLFPHIVRYPRFWKHNADGSVSRIKCEHCGQVLGSGASGKRYHYMRFHNWGNFFCSQCKFFAFYPNEYASHLLQKHPDMEGGVAATCPGCNEVIPLTTYGDENDPLTEHYKECAVGTLKLHSKLQRENPTLQCYKQVVCDICGKNMFQPSLQKHMETHSKREPIECSYPGCNTRCITRKGLAVHEKYVHGEQQERFYCEHCGKNIFKSKTELKNHIMFVHEKRSQDVKCTECDLVFARREQMVSHRNLVHFPDKHRCGTCLKPFGSEFQLKQHVPTHQDLKNYSCDVCGKRISRANSLAEHKRTHTGEKPFLCKYCPYRGSSSSLLCHHKRQVHKAQYEEEKKEKKNNKIKVSANPDAQ